MNQSKQRSVVLRAVFENLFELIHQYLQLQEIVALSATSKSVRIILIPQEDMGPLRNRPERKNTPITVNSSTINDWGACSTWMASYRFTIGSLILDNPEETLAYFKVVFCDCPQSCMPMRIIYRGSYVSDPLIAIADDLILGEDGPFSNCAEDCFSSLHSSNLSCNLQGVAAMDNGGISLDKIRIAVVTVRYQACLSSMRRLECVYLSRGIDTIERQTFVGYTSLTSIVLPESLTTIDHSSFYGCSSLTSVLLPESLTTIGICAFCGCSSLTSVVLPEGLTTIGSFTFYGCSLLTSVVLPDGLTSIGNSVFSGCSSLTLVALPARLANISASQYYNGSSLKVVLPHEPLR